MISQTLLTLCGENGMRKKIMSRNFNSEKFVATEIIAEWKTVFSSANFIQKFLFNTLIVTLIHLFATLLFLREYF